MAYIAKNTILKAYEVLSSIDDDKRQGLTQKVSALKYGIALGMYYKQYNDNCDLKNSANKDVFASLVGRVVKINDKQCTKDFFTSIAPNGRDYDCGSNFYSQSSVKDSKTNTDITVLYPKRSGWRPVMDVSNQVLIYNPDYIESSIYFYLNSLQLRCAFIVWLLRFERIETKDIDGLKHALNELLTAEYCNVLFPDGDVNDFKIEYDDVICELTETDIKNMFFDNSKDSQHSICYFHQQIFYGAPGTGKSDEVDNVCSKYPHHRITFHPDTDYSAFVGCYKPKTHKKNMLAGNGINETQLLSSFFDSNSSKYSGKNKARYLYEALVHTKDIRDLRLDAQTIADKLKAQNFSGCAYTTEATCMYNIYDWLKEDGYVVENKISYEFTPQCFIKAYVDAWKNQKEGKPVFLVIEEINRGNCAQIFGDLFQLLDRDKNGFSRYEISPDTDLQEYIAEIGLNISGVTDHEGKDISALIASGELMKLPNNLYIWATMNTSDQSLFPIDSAFKRRWDWKYIKIKKGIDKNTGAELNWKIKVGEERYDWWEFLNHINNKIARMTSSADKQLGYFFCLADGKGEINVDTFVNKVAFYLWNDVFKDYAEDGSPLLKYKKKEDDKGETDLTFPDFFDENGEIDTNVVKQFVEKVMKDDEMDKPVE